MRIVLFDPSGSPVSISIGDSILVRLVDRVGPDSHSEFLQVVVDSPLLADLARRLFTHADYSLSEQQFHEALFKRGGIDL